MRSSPLTGMRVVDLSQQLPGPYCTTLLASLGARVTKVEPPNGDAARHLDPAMFRRVSDGKTSIRLDLKTDRGREKLHDLVREADVFVEGFRPGVATRLGFDFDTLVRLSPGLVYCSISGFGQTGPAATRPTHDLNLQAMAGALAPDAVVDAVGVPWVDLGIATTAAFLITAHWQRGVPIHLDLAMLDVATAWASVKPSAVTQKEPTYGTFRAGDGTCFALALLEDDMWVRLCSALGMEAWSHEQGLDTYDARIAAGAEVRAHVQEEFARRDREEIMALALRFDLPLDPVRDAAGAGESEPVAWRRQLGAPSRVVPFGPGVGKPLRPFMEG